MISLLVRPSVLIVRGELIKVRGRGVEPVFIRLENRFRGMVIPLSFVPLLCRLMKNVCSALTLVMQCPS